MNPKRLIQVFNNHELGASGTIVPSSGHDWLNGTGNGHSCWSCVRRKYGKHPFTSCGICACGCDNVFFHPFS